MPSAFSRRAAETTIPAFDELLHRLMSDAVQAPAHLKEMLKEVQGAVETAKQVYMEKILPDED